MQIFFGSHTGKDLIEWDNYGNTGNLFSPPNRRTPSTRPYVLDNGAFGAFSNGTNWDEKSYLFWITRWIETNNHRPNWIVVPDVVGSKEATLRSWIKWESRLRKFNIPLAIAVQDGMDKTSIPSTADVIFVGGTTKWKIETIPYWAENFPRVHVARVNGWDRLWYCYNQRVESIDGSGFFRKTICGQPAINAHLFLRWQAGLVNASWREIWTLSPSRRRAKLAESLGLKFDFSDLPLFAK